MGYTQCCQQSYVHIYLLHGNNLVFQSPYPFDILVHVHLEVRQPAVHGLEHLFRRYFLLSVIADAPLRRKDTLVMAYEHAGAYGRLYPVLMVSHDKRRRQLVRLPSP